IAVVRLDGQRRLSLRDAEHDEDGARLCAARAPAASGDRRRERVDEGRHHGRDLRVVDLGLRRGARDALVVALEVERDAFGDLDRTVCVVEFCCLGGRGYGERLEVWAVSPEEGASPGERKSGYGGHGSPSRSRVVSSPLALTVRVASPASRA